MATDSDQDTFAVFGKELVDLLDRRGWHSIPKRELTLHFLHLAEKSGILSLEKPSLMLAARLRIPRGTLNGLLRDRALVLSNVKPFEIELFLEWLEKNNQTGQHDAAKGLLVCGAADPIGRMRAEGFLEKIGIVPDLKMNSSLLVIDLARLFGKISNGTDEGDRKLLVGTMKNLKIASEKQKAISEQIGRKTVSRLIGDVVVELAEKHGGKAAVALCSELVKRAWDLWKRDAGIVE